MSVRIITADVMEGLAQLPDGSVHCVVSSPPYWGLRDYDVAGQIGLEPTPDAFVARMVEVFREVRRVLRKDGTLWLNLGDSYAGAKVGNTNGGASSGLKRDGRDEASRQRTNEAFGEDMAAMGFSKPLPPGFKPKDLMGMPWRVAFSLQADGWWLRSDIIWSKPNPMPESVTDRPTKAHEYLFLLTQAERYHYDAEAIKEDGVALESRGGANKLQDIVSAPGAKNDGFGQRWRPDLRKVDSNNASYMPNASPHSHLHRAGTLRQMPVRNKRSVWTIATAPFPEAHFATFPPALAEICIKAGCPEGGVVLDPFAGAGTTLMVADRLGRDAIGIELNADYVAMAERRVARDRLERGQGAMADVAAAKLEERLKERAAKLPLTPLEALMQDAEGSAA